MHRAMVAAVAAVILSAVSGCGWTGPVNPSFSISTDDAEAALREMREQKKALERPVVVLAGYADPGFAVHDVAERVRGVATDPERVLEVAFLSAGSFDSARDRVIEKVEAAFPSDCAGETVEVDVIGISMGGLVARHAAMPSGAGGKRLKIARLFTIASPHRGARMAALPTLDQKQIGMRAGSAFLEALGQEAIGYELLPYARLGDLTVGEGNCAPEGMTPIWVPNRFPELSHTGAQNDPRIGADIARRLRGEAPYATEPRAALPE